MKKTAKENFSYLKKYEETKRTNQTIKKLQNNCKDKVYIKEREM